jgi:segregation and condensation protein B
MTLEAAELELADSGAGRGLPSRAPSRLSGTDQDIQHHSHDQEDDNGNSLKMSETDDSNGSSLIALKGIVEALLFVSGEPLSVDRLVTVLDGVSRAELIQAVRALQADYSAEGRGLQIVEIAGGYQITTRPDCASWIKRLEKVKAGAKLSRSAMETLAIIAYKQPLVRTEIEQIRGVDTAGVLRKLLDRRLIRIVGRKDMPGRPIMYGTTKQFLQSFGLKDLADLPALRDIKELGEPEQSVLSELSLPESIGQE